MILVKQSPSYQISHLYRLLYRKSIDDFFHSEGLYHSLDYLMHGTTYYKGGVIAIELDLITEKAKQLTEELKQLEIPTDNTIIGAGFLQLLTEQKKIIVAPKGMSKIKEALVNLHEQPWRDMDSLEIIDMRNADTKGGALILQEGASPRLHTLAIVFSLNQDITSTRPELTPLFEHLIHFIHQNSWTTVSMNYGAFSEGMNKPFSNDGAFTIPITFKVHPQAHEIMNQQDALEEVISIFLKRIQKYHTAKTIQQYISTLHHSTYSTDPLRLMPGPGFVTDTGFLVGAQGWRKIATVKNCELLLENTIITVKYGHKRISHLAVKYEETPQNI